MASMTHLFSIIIPCHNDAAHISRAISSVQAQTCDDWQVVLVNDGSTDDTEARALVWRARLGERFVYHCQPNAGVSAARNKGVTLATGRLLVFLDADDELLPGALHCYQTCLRQHPDVSWLLGHYLIQRGERTKTRRLSLPGSRQQRFCRFLEKKFFVGNVSNMCFELSLFKNLQFDERLRVGEDVALFALLFTQTDPLVVDEVVTRAHRRGDSLRTRSSFDQLAASVVVEAIFDHPHLAPEYQSYRNLFGARQARSLARHAYLLQDYQQVVRWSREAIQHKPAMLANVSFMCRYLKARASVSHDK